jgi:hypothetical protein
MLQWTEDMNFCVVGTKDGRPHSSSLAAERHIERVNGRRVWDLLTKSVLQIEAIPTSFFRSFMIAAQERFVGTRQAFNPCRQDDPCSQGKVHPDVLHQGCKENQDFKNN